MNPSTSGQANDLSWRSRDGWLWAAPLMGLCAASAAGWAFGPVGTIVATIIGMAVLALYFDHGVFGPSLRIAIVAAALLVAGLLIGAAQAGWTTMVVRTARADAHSANHSARPRFTEDALRKGGLASDALRGANLDGLTLDRLELHGPLDAAGASFVNTTLRDADLRDVVLRGATLTGTDLRGACLDRSDLSGALLDKDTKITGAHLAGATPPALPTEPVTLLQEWKDALASPCPR